jgi:hypothetical protein
MVASLSQRSDDHNSCSGNRRSFGTCRAETVAIRSSRARSRCHPGDQRPGTSIWLSRRLGPVDDDDLHRAMALDQHLVSHLVSTLLWTGFELGTCLGSAARGLRLAAAPPDSRVSSI